MIMMDSSGKFKQILNTRYRAHIHTSFSDGFNSVEEYSEWAFDHKIDTVVFTEHVREKLSFEFDSYLEAIENARRLFPSLDIWAGVESKILPGGSLDIPAEIVPRVQVLYCACHSFPSDVDLYENSFSRFFKDTAYKEKARVWAHPGNFFKHSGFTEEYSRVLQRLIKTAVSENILIENNLRYHMPPEYFLAGLSRSDVVIGHDAHSIESLGDVENK